MNQTPARPIDHIAKAQGRANAARMSDEPAVSPLLLAVLAALILRVVWALGVPVIPISDSIAYEMYAKTLATHGEYGLEPGKPSAFWPPGASAIYALGFKLVGEGYWPAVAINVFFGVAIVVLTGVLAARLLGKRAGAIAATLMALWPVHIQFSTVLASELPFTAFLLGAVLAWVGWRERPILRAFACGVLFAGACYIRPTAALIPVILAGVEFLVGPRRLYLRMFATPASTGALAGEALAGFPESRLTRVRTFLGAAGVGLVMALCIAPWSYHLTKTFGTFVVMSTNGGTVLWMGNNPRTTGFYQEDYPRQPGLNEAQSDKENGRVAREYILSDLPGFATRTLYKMARLHERQTIGVGWNEKGIRRALPQDMGDQAIKGLKIVSTAYWYGALGLGVIGLAVLVARRGLLGAVTSPLVLVWGYLTLVHAVYLVQDRYVIPSTPMIAALGALAIASVLDRRDSWRSARIAAAVAP